MALLSAEAAVPTWTGRTLELGEAGTPPGPFGLRMSLSCSYVPGVFSREVAGGTGKATPGGGAQGPGPARPLCWSSKWPVLLCVSMVHQWAGGVCKAVHWPADVPHSSVLCVAVMCHTHSHTRPRPCRYWSLPIASPCGSSGLDFG